MYYYIHRFQSTYIGDGWKRLARGTKCWLLFYYMRLYVICTWTANDSIVMSWFITSPHIHQPCIWMFLPSFIMCTSLGVKYVQHIAFVCGVVIGKTNFSHFGDNFLGKLESSDFIEASYISLRTTPPNNIIYNIS